MNKAEAGKNIRRWKRAIKIAVLGACILGFGCNAQSALVALWGFDNSDLAPAAGQGSQAATATLATSGTTSWLNPGTTVNDPRTPQAATYALQYGSSGGSFVIHVSGTGHAGFLVTYAGKKQGQSGSETWAYSTDNVNWTALATSPKIGPSWGAQTADFTAVTSLNGATSIYFRDTFNADYSFDNIQVLETAPEPVNIALGAFGGGLLALQLARRIYSRIKA